MQFTNRRNTSEIDWGGHLVMINILPRYKLNHENMKILQSAEVIPFSDTKRNFAKMAIETFAITVE